MKYLYSVAILVGLGIVIYFYGINFDNMSEEMLINSVLYWYVPLTFGLYGLSAYKVKKLAGPNDKGALRLIFSGKDISLTVIGIVIVILSGVVGFLVFMLPLGIFKIKSKIYDVAVALLGSLIWLIGLWFFFNVLWYSL